MSDEVLTQEDMKGVCADPGCDDPTHTRLNLVASCHPECGMIVSYEKTNGTLIVSCAHCQADVVTFLIAPSLIQ
jgi:hypothetical protein